MGSVSDTGIKISVVIPAYNMAEYVEEAIRSVLHGEFEDMEVIVIDDGSTDSTRSIVAKFTDISNSSYDPRVRYEYQGNSGKSVAVNRGLEIARGEYVTILDADDKLTQDSLCLRYRALKEGNATLAIGGFEVFDNDGDVVGRRPVSPIVDPEEIYESFFMLYKSPFHLNACLFSQRLCERVGPFDTQLQRCQDIDYSIRLLKAAGDITWIHETVYLYRKHRVSYIERARVRRRTIAYRPLVYWKNYKGWRRYLAIITGVMIDAGKFVYEIVGNYQN